MPVLVKGNVYITGFCTSGLEKTPVEIHLFSEVIRSPNFKPHFAARPELLLYFDNVLKLIKYLSKMINVIPLQSNFSVSEANRALPAQFKSNLAAVNWVGTACVFADGKQEGWCTEGAAGFDK